MQHEQPGDRGIVEKEFDFTHAYGPETTQEQIFKDCEGLMTSVRQPTTGPDEP